MPVVSDLPGLDLATFRTWYDTQRPGEIAGELSGSVIAGGKSNLTYAVTDGTTSWIVRRPPLGHVQATAHDMGREYTVMSALQGTDVPVPPTFAHCADDSVLGAPFYVMGKVDGVAYRTAAELEPVGADAVRAMGERMIDVLAQLHLTDPASVGLSDFGRPDGFLERQVRRWGQQLDGSRSRELPDADKLRARLAERVPAGDTGTSGIVHGDYRLDNLLAVAGDPDPVKAVVDWEMATLGDTLTDLALMQVYDRLGATAGGMAISDVSKAPGYPRPEDSLERYAQQTGRDLSRMDFHLGLAFFKLAVIAEGIHYRFQQGQTVGGGFDRIGDVVPPLLAMGLDALDS